MHPALKVVKHRPFPLPRAPWIMKQEWNDLLFAHWPLPPDYLRQFVPRELPLDVFDGQCWIAVTPFHMTGVRPRAVPALPGLSAFPELNVRTYVTIDDKPGVFFFSLDCANPPAVWSARTFYHLPYFTAKMSVTVGRQQVAYSSQRTRGRSAELHGSYAAVSHPFHAEPGTLEHFLVERYCLYTVHRGTTYRADIHHVPWPLQSARATFAVNTMADAAGIKLPDTEPLLHFAQHIEVLIWRLKRVD